MQLCFPFGFIKGLQICRKRASADSVSSDLSPLIINSYADQIMHFFAPFFGTKGLTNTVTKLNQKLSLNITNKFFHFFTYLLLLIIMNIVSAIKFNNSCI